MHGVNRRRGRVEGRRDAVKAFREDVSGLVCKIDALLDRMDAAVEVERGSAQTYSDGIQRLEARLQQPSELLSALARLDEHMAVYPKVIGETSSKGYEAFLLATQSSIDRILAFQTEIRGLIQVLERPGVVRPDYIPDAHIDYVSRDSSVTSAKAFTIDLQQELNRVGRFGFVVSDTSTILVKVNEREDITVELDEILDFKVEENWKIEKIRITTTSSTARDFRLFIA